jgi:hypothetical protein
MRCSCVARLLLYTAANFFTALPGRADLYSSCQMQKVLASMFKGSAERCITCCFAHAHVRVVREHCLLCATGAVWVVLLQLCTSVSTATAHNLLQVARPRTDLLSDAASQIRVILVHLPTVSTWSAPGAVHQIRSIIRCRLHLMPGLTHYHIQRFVGYRYHQ